MIINDKGVLNPTALSKFETGFKMPPSPLKSNICYTLQYLEYLEFQLNKIKTTNVLEHMTIKNYVINAVGVIEGLFRYLLKSSELNKENWVEIGMFKANQKDINGKKTYIETRLFEESDPVEKEIDFETVINKITDKQLIVIGKKAPSIIKNLKALRNKIHLHIAEDYSESDFNSFKKAEYIWSKLVLYSIITNEVFCNDKKKFNVFNPTQDEINYAAKNSVKERKRRVLVPRYRRASETKWRAKKIDWGGIK